MSIVLRVKRCAEESPQEALVLLSKRLKTEPEHRECSDLARSVFVFSGTVSEQDNVNVHLKKFLLKDEIRLHELKAVKNTKDILDKVRKERKELTSANRYEVLNLSRGLNDESNEEIKYSVVDIAKKSSEEKDEQYAYDLYFSQKRDFDVSAVDDVVRIEDLECELMFGSHRNDGRRTPDSNSVSSDDSNNENHWRNEYPDTEGSSIGEEDMRKAVEDIDIGNDLSSDADDEEVYNDPTVNINALNTEDVQRYGLAYAKYKARVLAGQADLGDKRNLVYCKEESGEESSEGYKDDEDGFCYGMEEDAGQCDGQDDKDDSDDLPD